MVCTCPKTTAAGERVSIVKLFDEDIGKFNFTSFLKTGPMMIDAHMNEDFCISHVIILDLSGFSIAHAAAFTPTKLKKIFHVILVSYFFLSFLVVMC